MAYGGGVRRKFTTSVDSLTTDSDWRPYNDWRRMEAVQGTTHTAIATSLVRVYKVGTLWNCLPRNLKIIQSAIVGLNPNQFIISAV